MKFRVLMLVNIGIGKASPVLGACTAFAYMGMRPDEYQMSAPSIFAALTAFNSLRMRFITLPFQIIQYFVLQVNLTRIRDFLLGEEFKKPTPCDPVTGNIVQFHHADLSWRSTSTDEDTKAKTKMSSESKEEPDFSFKDVHLSVKRGELVGVCGRVGSGKSTLLASVIGETSVSHGRVHAPENVGYVPQQAFIMSGTVLENVLMGRAFGEKRVEAVMEASAFDVDLAAMRGTPRGSWQRSSS